MYSNLLHNWNLSLNEIQLSLLYKAGICVSSLFKRNPYDHLGWGLVWGKYQLGMYLAFCTSNTCLLTELDSHAPVKFF